MTEKILSFLLENPQLIASVTLPALLYYLVRYVLPMMVQSGIDALDVQRESDREERRLDRAAFETTIERVIAGYDRIAVQVEHLAAQVTALANAVRNQEK